MSTPRGAATALDIFNHPNGRRYLAVDSLVDLLHGIAESGPPNEVASFLRYLADTFQQMNEIPGDPGLVDRVDVVRVCTCGAEVVDGVRHPSFDPITLDANVTPNGPWVPMASPQHAGMIAVPWEPRLDSSEIQRHREHRCGR